MLLTNLKITGSRRDLWRMVENYLVRWRIEETIRFIKQSYRLEDIRLLTYVRLQNMMALVTAVTNFTMAYLGLKTKLRVLMRHLLKAAKRVFGIPEFRFYALTMALRNISSPENGASRAQIYIPTRTCTKMALQSLKFWGNSRVKKT